MTPTKTPDCKPNAPGVIRCSDLVSRCATCKFMAVLKAVGSEVVGHVCLAPSVIDGEPFIYQTHPNGECELWTANEKLTA